MSYFQFNDVSTFIVTFCLIFLFDLVTGSLHMQITQLRESDVLMSYHRQYSFHIKTGSMKPEVVNYITYTL